GWGGAGGGGGGGGGGGRAPGCGLGGRRPSAGLAGRVSPAPRRQARRAAWAAALLIAIVTAFVPLFWLITVVVMAVGVALRYRRSRALDALIVLAVPLLLLLPWSFDILTHPGRPFLEAGLARPRLAAAR